MLLAQLRIDSLELELSKSISNEQRVHVLNALAFEWFGNNPAHSAHYLKESKALASSINFTKGLAEAETFSGIYCLITGDTKCGIAALRSSLKRLERIEWMEMKGYTTMQVGNYYRDVGNYDSAFHFYNLSIPMLEAGSNTGYLSTAYKNLGRLYETRADWDNALNYLEKAQTLRETAQDSLGIMDSRHTLGLYYLNRGDFAKAIFYFESLKNIADRINSEEGQLNYYLAMGELNTRQGKFSNALSYLLTTLEILEKKEDTSVQKLIRCYLDIGHVYHSQGYYARALEYHLKGLRLAEEGGFKPEQARALQQLSWLAKDQRQFDYAEQHANRAKELYEESGNERGVAGIYNILGLIQLLKGNNDLSIQYHEQAYEIRKRLNYKTGMAASLFNMALAYEALGKLQRALDLYLESLKLEEENKYELGISYNQIGAVLTKLKRYEEAGHYLFKARQLATESGSKELLKNNYGFLAEYYESQNSIREALRYHKLFKTLNDSLYNEQNARQMAEMQATFELEKKEREIAFLQQQKELQDKQLLIQQASIRQQRIIIISAVTGIILITIVAFSIFSYYKKVSRLNREIGEQKEEIQAQSEELIEANQTIAQINRNLEEKVDERTTALTQAYKELDTFFYRSSHDFRRPITTFLGLAEVAKITVKDQSALELFDKVRETASNLDKMLVKLQSISDVGGQQMVYKEVMLREIFDSVLDSNREAIHQKNIEVSLDLKLRDALHAYPAMIKIIFENLLENSIQFCTPENPMIRVMARQEGSFLTLEFSDNGQGIESAYHDRIFEMYYRANHNSKGNGLGLYIVKKAVEKLNGSITFTSEYLHGTVFTITLPMTQKIETSL